MGDAILHLGSGVAQGFAKAQEVKTQREYFKAMQAKMKAEVDMLEKKQAFVSQLPPDQQRAFYMGMKPDEAFRAKLLEQFAGAYGLGGGSQPVAPQQDITHDIAAGQLQQQGMAAPPPGQQAQTQPSGPPPGQLPFNFQGPAPQDLFRFSLTGDPGSLFPKVFFQEDGPQYLLRDEYGNIRGTHPRAQKMEAVDQELPGGGKRRQYIPPPYTGGGGGQPGPSFDMAQPKAEEPANASKLQNLQGGIEDAQSAISAFMNQDGTVNQKAVLGAYTHFPGSAGRQAYSAWQNAVDAIVRGRTGAVVSANEWSQYENIYLPSPFDSEEAQKAKLNRLMRDLQGVLEKSDPTGAQRSRTGQQSKEKQRMRYDPASGKLVPGGAP